MVNNEIIKKICRVAKRYKVEKVILFGSYARRTQTKKSDLDLIFIQDTQKRFLDRLNNVFEDLAYLLKLPLEIFVYTPKEFEEMKRESFFIKRAVREGKVIYEHRKAE